MYDIKDINLHRERKLKSLVNGDLDLDLAEFKLNLKNYFSPEDYGIVLEVYDFAQSQSYGEGVIGKNYISHPLRVANFLLDWQKSRSLHHRDQIVAALIHNVLEKKVLSHDELRTKFGNWIADTIIALTPNRMEMKTEVGQKKYYAGIGALDIYGQVLKFFDKFDNIYSICLESDDEERKKYLDEIDVFIKPIAQKHSGELYGYFLALLESAKKLGHLPYKS